MAFRYVKKFGVHHFIHPMWSRTLHLCLCQRRLDCDIDSVLEKLEWRTYEDETEDEYLQNRLREQWEEEVDVLEEARYKLCEEIKTCCSSLGDCSGHLSCKLRRLDLEIDSVVLEDCEKRKEEARIEILLHRRKSEMSRRRQFIACHFGVRN